MIQKDVFFFSLSYFLNSHIWLNWPMNHPHLSQLHQNWWKKMGKKRKKKPPQIEHNYWVAITISVLIHLISFRYLINTHYNISLCNFLEVYLNLHERVERMWEMLTNFCANYMNGLGGHMEGQIMQMYSTRQQKSNGQTHYIQVGQVGEQNPTPSQENSA